MCPSHIIPKYWRSNTSEFILWDHHYLNIQDIQRVHRKKKYKSHHWWTSPCQVSKKKRNAHSHQFLLQQLGKERNNNHMIWKERNRTVTICRWHDIIYRNSKDSTIKLRYNTFIQVADYKINIARPVAFLYTNNKISEREINNKNSVYNCIKNNKRGIHLTKEVKDLLLWKLWNTKERNWRWHK